ncbi:MAG: hypothetical protein ABI091_08360 [Ferruginibacter sp.]
MKLYIKYMVSLRCKMMVKEELKKLGIGYATVDLGIVQMCQVITKEKREELKTNLFPDRLNPPKKFYIVWMNSDNHSAKNIGQIKTSSSLLSKTLKSSLKTVSTTQPTSFFITSEDDANIQYPAGVVVLTTQ